MKNRSLAIAALLVAASLSSAFAQRSASQASPPLLFIYEAKDKNIDPWISLFKEELQARDMKAEFAVPAELAGKDLSAYNDIVLYGMVQAFASMEPIRDWLKTDVNLSGKNVHLFVTANQWSLKKYFDQLNKALAKKKANVVDAVSSATKKLSPSEKSALVKDFIEKIR
jgi:hypothetical protein